MRGFLLMISGAVLGLALAQVPGEFVSRSLAAWQAPEVRTYWHDVNRRLKADRLDSNVAVSSHQMVRPQQPVQPGFGIRAEPPVHKVDPPPAGCESAFSRDVNPELSFIIRSCET
jgi:hypothetical protein